MAISRGDPSRLSLHLVFLKEIDITELAKFKLALDDFLRFKRGTSDKRLQSLVDEVFPEWMKDFYACVLNVDKEVTSKVIDKIAKTKGISFAEAEKKVAADEMLRGWSDWLNENIEPSALTEKSGAAVTLISQWLTGISESSGIDYKTERALNLGRFLKLENILSDSLDKIRKQAPENKKLQDEINELDKQHFFAIEENDIEGRKVIIGLMRDKTRQLEAVKIKAFTDLEDQVDKCMLNLETTSGKKSSGFISGIKGRITRTLSTGSLKSLLNPPPTDQPTQGPSGSNPSSPSSSSFFNISSKRSSTASTGSLVSAPPPTKSEPATIESPKIVHSAPSTPTQGEGQHSKQERLSISKILFMMFGKKDQGKEKDIEPKSPEGTKKKKD